jgi:uncharacterized protein
MLIKVRVISNAKEERVTQTGETSFEVRVGEKPVGGRANKRLLEILSEHFNVPKSRIAIVRGVKSRDKIVEIILEPGVPPMNNPHPGHVGGRRLSHVLKIFPIGPILFGSIFCLAGGMGDLGDSGRESYCFQFFGLRVFVQIVRG